jgi:hypothetical protein
MGSILNSNIMTVRVYNTRTQAQKTIETSVTKWGELKEVLNGQGVETHNLKAINGETEVTYDSPDAILPDNDFTLFLIPEKVKSGADDSLYWRYRAQIAEIISQEGAEARDHFNEGRPYTNKSTEDLGILLEEWNSASQEELLPEQDVDCASLETALLEVREMLLVKDSFTKIILHIDEVLGGVSVNLANRARQIAEKLQKN